MADIISVSELNKYVKTLLESDAVLYDIAISGEISNFTNHFKTGHFYFSLKDNKSSVKAVMFKIYSQNLNFLPENGMSVIVRGQISLFERDGAFQIYVDYMTPDGIGAMQLAYEQLKARLEEEGLFAIEHKKMLPQMPKCIGLVTSKTGAAIQDIFNVANRRNPNSHFLLCSVNVQGQKAQNGIANAIKTLDESKKCDVIIVARGGGSKEDLWVFNSEIIARAAYNCKIPVVSAIGHEIDFCILDFVSDLRAPTPSAAAELVVPDMNSELEHILNTAKNIENMMQYTLQNCYNKIDDIKSSNILKNAQIITQIYGEKLESSKNNLNNIINLKINNASKTLKQNAKLLTSLNPYDVLARGYAFAKKDNETLRTYKQVDVGDEVFVKLHEGGIKCSITQIESDDKTWQKKN